jgi:hypothetical protein
MPADLPTNSSDANNSFWAPGDAIRLYIRRFLDLDGCYWTPSDGRFGGGSGIRTRDTVSPNQRPPSRSRNASYVGQRVYRSCGLRAGVRLTLQGSPANRSLSAIEPVSAPPKWKLKNGDQRPAPGHYEKTYELWKEAGIRVRRRARRAHGSQCRTILILALKPGDEVVDQL